MKFLDILKFSIKNLSQRGLRSWLTILGIVIGVAAVVSILSIGAGMQQTISSQLAGLGSDVGYVIPGFERAMRANQRIVSPRITSVTIKLTDKDFKTIKYTPGIKIASGIIAGRTEVQYYGEKISLQLYGVEPLAFQEISVVDVEEGRHLAMGDENVAVIGNRVASEIFKKPITINSQISINNKTFRVVGILERFGGMVGGIMYDNAIFVTTNAARNVLNVSSNEFSIILFKVSNLDNLDEISKDIEKRLMLSRHVTNETKDFTIITAKSIQETISSILNTVNLFLAGIAAISLLVGAIGIANTMYMSVIERTRQIGTLKALGATNSDVMKMFLFESSIIGFVGGLIGVFLGFIASGIISEMGVNVIGISRGQNITIITPELVLFALIFSTLIGAISGLLPARKAAQLQPIEALRYE
jgi:putative ABC transport system permease protein